MAFRASIMGNSTGIRMPSVSGIVQNTFGVLDKKCYNFAVPLVSGSISIVRFVISNSKLIIAKNLMVLFLTKH